MKIGVDMGVGQIKYLLQFDFLLFYHRLLYHEHTRDENGEWQSEQDYSTKI